MPLGPTGSRMPSTTAPVVARVGPSRTARAYHLLESFAAAIADALLAGLSGAPRCACGCASRTSCSIRLSPTRPCASSAVAAVPSRYEMRILYVASRLPFPRVTARNPNLPAPVLRNVSFSLEPEVAARASRFAGTIWPDDTRRALFPEAEVEVEIGRQGGGHRPVLRQPDAVDVPRVLGERESRLNRRRATRLRRERRDRVVV